MWCWSFPFFNCSQTFLFKKDIGPFFFTTLQCLKKKLIKKTWSLWAVCNFFKLKFPQIKKNNQSRKYQKCQQTTRQPPSPPQEWKHWTKMNEYTRLCEHGIFIYSKCILSTQHQRYCSGAISLKKLRTSWNQKQHHRQLLNFRCYQNKKYHCRDIIAVQPGLPL